jgi:hypothetical protein
MRTAFHAVEVLAVNWPIMGHRRVGCRWEVGDGRWTTGKTTKSSTVSGLLARLPLRMTQCRFILLVNVGSDHFGLCISA